MTGRDTVTGPGLSISSTGAVCRKGKVGIGASGASRGIAESGPGGLRSGPERVFHRCCPSCIIDHLLSPRNVRDYRDYHKT